MLKPRVRVKLVGAAKAKALSNALKRTNGSSVTVGVHENAGSYPDGTSVVAVATYNEFGTQNIPERSFIRSSVNEGQSLIKQWREEVFEQIAQKQMSPAKALTALGTRVMILIQNKIKSNVPPPNAASTVAKKQAKGVAPRTLIDTTLLLRSISFQVYLAGQDAGGKGAK